MPVPSSAASRPGSGPAAVLVPILVALLVYMTGRHIPIPGLDVEILRFDDVPGTETAMFSIFALGEMPYLTVLAVAELVTLAFPVLIRRQGTGGGGARLLTLVVRLAALGFAAHLGHDLLVALADTGAVAPDMVGFLPAGIACSSGRSPF